MREFLVIIAMLVLLVSVATGVVYALGGSFGLDLQRSFALAALAVCFAFPGVMCLRIAASRDDRMSRRERIGNFIRGIGFMVMAVGAAIPVFTTVAAPAVFAWAIGIGFALYFISLFL